MLYIGIKYVQYFLEGYVLMSLNLHSLILEIGMLYHDVLVSTCCLYEENITWKLMKRRKLLRDKISKHHVIQNESLTDKKCEKRFIQSLRNLCCAFYLRCKRWTSSKNLFSALQDNTLLKAYQIQHQGTNNSFWNWINLYGWNVVRRSVLDF